MGDAIWLFLALPTWYFSIVTAPFAASYLTAVPASGILSLFAGAGLALARREAGVLWAFVGIVLSHGLVVIAGWFRGQFEQPGALLLAFIGLQFLIVGLVIALCRRSRLAGLLVGWFMATYGLFAAFIAGMAFPDTWL